MATNYTPVDDSKSHSAPINARGTSSGIKEAEPVSAKAETYTIQEVVEHEPSEEVKPYIEKRAESIKLPLDLKKIGIQATSKISFPTYQNIHLPISDDKIIKGLHAPITSSLRWLATLAMYLLRQAHLGLRVVEGKVVRVIKN